MGSKLIYWIILPITFLLGWIFGKVSFNYYLDLCKELNSEIIFLKKNRMQDFVYITEDIMCVREEIQELRKRVIELEKEVKKDE